MNGIGRAGRDDIGGFTFCSKSCYAKSTCDGITGTLYGDDYALSFDCALGSQDIHTECGTFSTGTVQDHIRCHGMLTLERYPFPSSSPSGCEFRFNVATRVSEGHDTQTACDIVGIQLGTLFHLRVVGGSRGVESSVLTFKNVPNLWNPLFSWEETVTLGHCDIEKKQVNFQNVHFENIRQVASENMAPYRKFLMHGANPNAMIKSVTFKNIQLGQDTAGQPKWLESPSETHESESVFPDTFDVNRFVSGITVELD